MTIKKPGSKKEQEIENKMKKHQKEIKRLWNCTKKKPKKEKEERINDTENGLSRNGIDNNDDAHTFYYSLYYYY